MEPPLQNKFQLILAQMHKRFKIKSQELMRTKGFYNPHFLSNVLDTCLLFSSLLLREVETGLSN